MSKLKKSRCNFCNGSFFVFFVFFALLIFYVVIRNNFDYDQLIWEKGNDTQPAWVHVSYKLKGANRKEVLKYNGSTYTKM